jgi:hypothetical protein
MNADGSVTIPTDTVRELGLKSGDVLRVRLEPAEEQQGAEQDDSERIRERFAQFFDRLDRIVPEEPPRGAPADPAEAAFAEAMDGKYRRLGFR